jgi:hypothetical protein
VKSGWHLAGFLDGTVVTRDGAGVASNDAFGTTAAHPILELGRARPSERLTLSRGRLFPYLGNAFTNSVVAYSGRGSF